MLEDSAAPIEGLPQEIRNQIVRDGWMAMMVEDNSGEMYWAYSVGLFYTYNHPEVIVCGLANDDMFALLDNIATQVRNGEVFVDKGAYSELLNDANCYFAAVDQRYYAGYMGRAVDFYGEREFPTLQCIWSDRQGFYPWDTEFDESLKDYQLLLTPELQASLVPGESPWNPPLTADVNSLPEPDLSIGTQTQRLDPDKLPLPARPCLRCGQVMNQAEWDGPHHLYKSIPNWFSSSRRVSTPVLALVCTRCGYVEFYAPEAHALDIVNEPPK